MKVRVHATKLSLAFAILVVSTTGLIAQESDPLKITTALSQTHVATNADTVRLWINIANTSGTDVVRTLTVREVFPSQMQIRAVSWCSPPAGSTQIFPACSVAAVNVLAGARLSLWLDAVVTKSDEFKPGLVLTWNNAADQEFVGFDTLRSETPWNRFLEPNPLWALFLPAFGALFTLGVQAYFARKTRLTETWNLMLPESHKNNMTSYIGLAGWSHRAIESFNVLKASDATKDAVQHEARTKTMVFAIVMTHWGTRNIAKVPGGLYLKDRQGEKLIIYCEKKYREGTLPVWCESQKHTHDATALMSGILDEIENFESPASFWRKVDSVRPWVIAGRERELSKSVGILVAHAYAWSQSPEAARSMKWLEARRLLLEYEINRPYETWYGKKETLTVPKDVERLLLEDPEEGKNAGFYMQSARPSWGLILWEMLRERLLERRRQRRLKGLTQ